MTQPVAMCGARNLWLLDWMPRRRILCLGCTDVAVLGQILEQAPEALWVVVDDIPKQATLKKALPDLVCISRQDIAGLSSEEFDLILGYDLAERMMGDIAPNAMHHADRAAVEHWDTLLRRILSPEGFLFLPVAGGNPKPGALDYEAAMTRLGPHFAHVSTFGETQFEGSLLYSFEETDVDPELSLDRSLLDFADQSEEEGDEPDHYLLLFGPGPLEKDALTVVQWPKISLLEDPDASSSDTSMRVQNQVEVASLTEALMMEARAPLWAQITAQQALLESQSGDLDALRKHVADAEQVDGIDRNLKDEAALTAQQQIEAHNAAEKHAARLQEALEHGLAQQLSRFETERQAWRMREKAYEDKLAHVEEEVRLSREDKAAFAQDRASLEAQIGDLLAEGQSHRSALAELRLALDEAQHARQDLGRECQRLRDEAEPK